MHVNMTDTEECIINYNKLLYISKSFSYLEFYSNCAVFGTW